MFFGERVAAPRLDALLLALSSRPGLVMLRSEHALTRAPITVIACDPDAETHDLDPFEGRAARPSADARASYPKFFGILPYEARRAIERPAWSPTEDRPAPLAPSVRWWRYPAVISLEPRGTALVSGVSRGAVSDLARAVRHALAIGAEARLPRVALTASVKEPDEEHIRRIERARELILAGDLYQVNLARAVDLTLECGSGDPSNEAWIALFFALDRRTRARFAALFLGDTPIIGSSPELCLSAIHGANGLGFDELRTEPIKGTRPRGRDARADRDHAAKLAESPKERAELAMIVDVERNDLHRVCKTGSVRVVGAPVVRTLPTVHHRFAELLGRARPALSRREILDAFLPSGSVTGAPKVRAMEVIRSLEPRRRGLYTGAMGYASHAGDLVLSMAIRTAVFHRSGRGEYLTGGGIVVGSDPREETAETRWKASQLDGLDSAETPAEQAQS